MALSLYKDQIVSSSKDKNEFKVPLQPAPKKKKVLPEEAYVKKLSNIIERDFFPELDNLKDKLGYLKASELNDTEMLKELQAKYSDYSNYSRVEDSPATFDTPVNKTGNIATPNRDSSFEDVGKETIEGSSGIGLKESKLSDDKLPSLDKFMAKYTSEDNESFENVIEEQAKKFRLKHPWLFEAENLHNKLYTPNMNLASIEEQHNQKVLAITGISDKEKDTRLCTLENWNYKTFNSVMYVPDGAPLSNRQLLEYAKIKNREVLYDNTRFTESPFSETLSQSAMLEASAIQAYKKEGKVGIDGKELKESPKVNGYSYARTPSPAPGVNCTPLMTWGEVEGTPFQLDGSMTPLLKSSQGPSYNIPKISDRDELHLKLAEKVSQNHRDSKSKAISKARSNLSSPALRKNQQSSSFERLSSMSPAAQKLFTSKLSFHRNSDRALNASYTPSPMQRKSSLVSTPKLTPRAKTPLNKLTPAKVAKRPSTPASESSGLTDNLLNLPKRLNEVSESPVIYRKRASDFF